jgi:hypothetical protein
MRVIVVIASSTRGFTTPRDGTPTVINPCPSTQDQDESLTVSLDGYVTGSADRVDAAMGMNGFRLFRLTGHDPDAEWTGARRADGDPRGHLRAPYLRPRRPPVQLTCGHLRLTGHLF